MPLDTTRRPIKLGAAPIPGAAPGGGTIAPLANVALFDQLLCKVVERPRHLPGIGVFYGYSGFGKTFSATYGANRFRAFYLEVGDTWTRKHFLRQLLLELGLQPARTTPEMAEQAIDHLAINQRPLIIDECDWVLQRGYIETLRQIHNMTGTPLILIGEELMPQRLARKSERTDNRVLDWVAAQPSGASDAAHLARLYVPEVEIGHDLLERMAQQARGQVRRIIVSLELVREEAALKGLERIGLSEWGDKPLFRGEAPQPRTRLSGQSPARGSL